MNSNFSGKKVVLALIIIVIILILITYGTLTYIEKNEMIDESIQVSSNLIGIHLNGPSFA
ncbi:hypothetical protein [Alkalibacillus aidingensis]|uniref:hypothetical protein n=1 Tax=Alkalibacillus aidingensis TaxID=2747607 RepID=UPI001661830A|nr:hypothetical protein [Alkalibacillus aidingensis]